MIKGYLKTQSPNISNPGIYTTKYVTPLRFHPSLTIKTYIRPHLSVSPPTYITKFNLFHLSMSPPCMSPYSIISPLICYHCKVCHHHCLLTPPQLYFPSISPPIILPIQHVSPSQYFTSQYIILPKYVTPQYDTPSV